MKLHKVLYYSDMFEFARSGTPLTGATYSKRPFGPTCDQLLKTLRELENENAIHIRDVDYFGFRKKEYIPVDNFKRQRINDSEIELLDEVIDFVCKDNSAKTISEFSHNRAWELAEFGEVLPYTSVFQIFPTQVSEDAMEWAASQVNEIEAEKSRSNAVDYVDFAAFRSRVLEERRRS